MPPSAFRGLLAASLTALAACSELTPRLESLTKSSVAAQYHLQDQVIGSPVGGRERKLAAGSTWQAVGTIAEGDVYRPVGTILTAEAMNVHEAYIVVRDRRWVGSGYRQKTVSLRSTNLQRWT